MTSMPDWARVEIAFGTAPDSTTPNWTDVSAYVDALSGYSSSRGRTDWFSNVTAGQASYTLNNRDGRFTAEYASGAYYPNVVLGARTRISCRQQTGGVAGNPIPTVSGNLVVASQAECSTIIGFTPIGSSAPGLATDSTHVFSGGSALLVTWATGGTQTGGFQITVSGLVIGRTYTFSIYVYVPSGGSPAVIGFVSGLALTSASAVTNAYTRLSCSFVANAVTANVGLLNNAASTAGQQVWCDAIQVDEGSTLGTFTSSPPPISYRYDGCIEAWPVQWAPTGVYSEAQVTSSDRLKRMGQTRVLPDIIGCEYYQDSPQAYYNLGDEAGATSAGNSAATPQGNLVATQRGTGGTVTFGNATGPPTDGLTAAQFVASSATNGKYLAVTNAGGIVTNANSAISLECWYLTSSATSQYLMVAQDGYGSSFNLQISAAGKLVGQMFDVFGGTTTTVTSAATVSDGLMHQAILQCVVSAGTVTLTLVTDGVSNTGSYSAAFLILPVSLYVGGGPTQNTFTGTLAHVALFPNAIFANSRYAQHLLAGTTGFAGERSDQRITRLAGYAGINGADVSVAELGSSSLDAQDTSGQQAVDLINACTTTENGVAYFKGDGTLGVQGRSHRYNRSVAVTLQAGEYNNDLTPVLDDFGVQNDVTATRAGGASARVVNQPSITAIGTYTGQLDLICNSDSEVVDSANWRVNTSGTPAVRYPQMSVDIGSVSAATALSVLALDIGDRINMAGLPATAPTGTPDLYVEGWSESYTNQRWTITFNCSRVRLKSVWTLDSTSFSVLDSTTRLAY